MYMDFINECKTSTEDAPSDGFNMSKVSSLAGSLDAVACCLGTGTMVGKTLDKIIRELSIVAADDPRAPEETQAMMVPLLGFLNGEEKEPEDVAHWLTKQLV